MNILLINLHGLFEEGLKSLIAHYCDDSAFGDAQRLDQVRDEIDTEIYDLAIFDLDSLVPDAALDFIKVLAVERNSTPFIVLSSSESSDLADLVLEYGAAAYVSKSKNREDLMHAIQKLYPAEQFKEGKSKPSNRSRGDFPASIMQEVTAQALTPRQLDVLRELSKGKSNKHIACDLSVSENTVRNHLSAVFRILRARNRTEALCHATSLRIIPDLSEPIRPISS